MGYIEQWDILESEVKNYDSNFPDAISRIKYAFVLYDVESNGDENTFRFGEVFLTNPIEGSFKPFSELTHKDFVSFIKTTHGQAKINEMVNDMISELKLRPMRFEKIEIKAPWQDNSIAIDPNIPKFDNQLDYLLKQNQ